MIHTKTLFCNVIDARKLRSKAKSKWLLVLGRIESGKTMSSRECCVVE